MESDKYTRRLAGKVCAIRDRIETAGRKGIELKDLSKLLEDVEEVLKIANEVESGHLQEALHCEFPEFEDAQRELERLLTKLAGAALRVHEAFHDRLSHDQRRALLKVALLALEAPHLTREDLPGIRAGILEAKSARS